MLLNNFGNKKITGKSIALFRQKFLSRDAENFYWSNFSVFWKFLYFLALEYNEFTYVRQILAKSETEKWTFRFPTRLIYSSKMPTENWF